MNTSPRHNVEGTQTIITCMAMQATKNMLKEGQKAGDATKAINSGSLEVTNLQMPIIENNVVSHKVTASHREINGEKYIRSKSDEKRRKLQLSIIKEQQEQQEKSGEEIGE